MLPTLQKVRLLRGEVDLVTGRGRVAGRAIRLSEAQCALLAVLVARPGETVDRDVLTQAIGARPDSPRRILDLAILRLRNRIEVDPKEPAHILSVFNEGYRFAPLPAEPGVTLGLPPERAPLVGRAADVVRVHEALLHHGWVTLTGTGGTGKTTLALRVARTAPFPWVAFVPLAAVRTASDLLVAVARVLEIPTADLTTDAVATARVLGGLRDRPGTLLVLDEGDGALPALAAFAAAVAGAAPQTTILVTSRVLLGRATEHAIRLGPLDETDAMALFVDLAHAVDAPVAADDPALPALVQRLDRLPLALELAAARARALSPAAMLARLDERFRLLDGLRATLLWSWSLLDEPARDALARLSAFVGPVSAEAARAILGPTAADRVDTLATASWVARRGSEIVLLEAIRALGLEQAAALGVLEEAEDAHARYHAELATRLRGPGPVDLEALDALDAVLPELLAVGRTAARDPSPAVAVIGALHDRFHVRGPIHPLIALVETTLAGGGPMTDQDRNHLRFVQAAALRLVGELEEGLGVVRAALRAAPEDQRGRLLVEQGTLLWEAGRRTEAREAFEAALELPMDARNRTNAMASLANALQDFGESERAVTMLEACVDEATRVGDPRAGSYLANLGTQQLNLGRLTEAEASLTRALTQLEALGNERRCANIHYNLAVLHAEHRQFAEAAVLCDRADHGWARFGAHRTRIYTALLQAELSLAQGRPDDALVQLDLALERIEGVGAGSPARIQEAGDRVVALAGLGRVDEAEAMLARVADLGAAPTRLAVLRAHVSGDRRRLPDLDIADGASRFLASLFR